MIRQIFFPPYLASDGLIHKSSPLSRGFLPKRGERGGEGVGGALPPLLSTPASRWSVKNRGVHCNLVLWLMRLSSV